VEVTHFLEYGLLSFLLFKAFSHHIKDNTIYLNSIFVVLIIGTLDEIIQWIVPGRVWNFKDVGLNVFSGILIQFIIWKVVRPKIISRKVSLKSFRLTACLFSLGLVIIGLCASNTPQRVYKYSQRISCLSFLQKQEPMSRFGYKYKEPEIGIFYSRMSPKTLQKIDNNRGKEYAQILNQTADGLFAVCKRIQSYNSSFSV
jgi:hypothetical protein